jgi:hypothetical protein
MALTKKYGNNLSGNAKFMPQFAEGAFKDIKIADCDSVVGGGTIIKNPAGVTPGQKIKIDGFDVGKAVQWLYDHDLHGSGKACAAHVEDAIHAGGLHRLACSSYKGSKFATNLHYGKLLSGEGFDCIYAGTCDKNNRDCAMNGLQAGDVAIIGRDMNIAGETGRYHACMWTGKEWFSDFNQGLKMSPYGSDEQYGRPKSMPYFIYRYHSDKVGVKYE